MIRSKKQEIEKISYKEAQIVLVNRRVKIIIKKISHLLAVICSKSKVKNILGKLAIFT